MESIKRSFYIQSNKPLILVFTGISGAGKDTLINCLSEQSNYDFHFVVTCNTRKMREGEIDGVNYHFITKEKFIDMVNNNEMIEHAQVYDDFKGVPRFEIDKAFADGKDMILRLDIQGTRRVKEVYPEAITIFIIPPDDETWLSRLRSRGTEAEESLQIRLNTAIQEISSVSDFDYLVVNDKLDSAVEEILSIITAEHARTSRRSIIMEKA